MASAQAQQTRRLARIFTPSTPMHYPLLDPKFPPEDIDLVPAPLAPRGQLSYELPKKARTILHIMLKLSNKADELLEEFHGRIPQISEAISEWAEMRGASPTSTGEEQLRAHATRMQCCNDGADTTQGERSAENQGYVFNMVRNLDTPGRADVIYLTDATEDSDSHDQCPDSIAQDIKHVSWLDFDASYAHLVEAEREPEAKVLGIHDISMDASAQRHSDLPRFRTPEWESPDYHLPKSAYSPPGERPFNDYWLKTHPPYADLTLGSNDDEPLSPCSTPGYASDSQSPIQPQDSTRLMVPHV